MVLFTTFAPLMNNLGNITPEEKTATIITIIIHLILVWTVVSKIDEANKNGWTVFTLVYGIFILLNGIVISIISPFNGIGRIIAGVFLITAFALKISHGKKDNY